MASKSITTLVEDIYSLVSSTNISCTEEERKAALDNFGKTVVQAVERQLSKKDENSYLRMSQLGRGDRQIWYDLNGTKAEELLPHTRIKFMYGDIIEALVLCLAKLAGHSVEGEQDTIFLNGVEGHRDAVIDGATVDVKSTSTRSLDKFSSGSLFDNDSFGYIDQISSYVQGSQEDPIVTVKDRGYFLAVGKENGNIALLEVNSSVMRNMSERIQHLKDMKEIPDRCYPDEADGKSGNKKLGVNCSYCPFKKECWKDANDGEGLRVFLYSNGPRFLTHVSRVPDVPEIQI